MRVGYGLEAARVTRRQASGWRLAPLVLALASCSSVPNGECLVTSRCIGGRAPDAGVATAAAHPALTHCGDGVLDPGEECDDGSACADGRVCTDDRYRCDGTSRASCEPRGGDGCSSACTLESTGGCGGAGAGAACNSGEMAAPSLPLDDPSGGASSGGAMASGGSTSSGGPTIPGMNGDDTGVDGDEPLDETDTTPEPPVCEWGPFGQPQPIRGLDTGLNLWSPALAASGQTLYFAANPANTVEAIFSAKRDRRSAVSAPTRLTALDSGEGDGTPFVSFDGLSLYFYTERVGDGDRDLWLATRPNVVGEFVDPRPLLGINTNALDHLPWLSVDELTLLFVSNRTGSLGQSDIWIATRPTRAGIFEDTRPLAGVNSTEDEGRAVMSRDERTIFYSSARQGSGGGHDIWTATRTNGELAFGPPTNSSAVNSTGRDIDPYLSANERELWFSSDRDGSVKVWRSVRACIE